MSCLDSATLEQAISIVNSWETGHLARLLTNVEARSLIQAIAHELRGVLDGRLDACRGGDFLRDAYGIVDAWDGPGKSWHLNAAEAATLAESIAQALAKACADTRQAPPDIHLLSPEISW